MVIPIKYNSRFKEEKTHQKLELNRHTLFDQSVQMKIVLKSTTVLQEPMGARDVWKRGPSSSLWCSFLRRTRFLFCTYDFPHSGQRCCSTGTYFCGSEVVNGWPVVSTSTSAETPIALPSVTADISICNMESSDLVSNLSGMT